MKRVEFFFVVKIGTIGIVDDVYNIVISELGFMKFT